MKKSFQMNEFTSFVDEQFRALGQVLKSINVDIDYSLTYRTDRIITVDKIKQNQIKKFNEISDCIIQAATHKYSSRIEMFEQINRVLQNTKMGLSELLEGFKNKDHVILAVAKQKLVDCQQEIQDVEVQIKS